MLQGLRVYEGHARLLMSWQMPLASNVQVCVRQQALFWP